MSFRSRGHARALPDPEPGLPRPGNALAPYAAIVVAAALYRRTAGELHRQLIQTLFELERGCDG